MNLPLAFNAELFIQLLVNGITLGSLYALIALGYSMVYGILKLLNFAHGDVYMIGAFVGYGVLTLLGGPLSPNIALAPLIVLMFLAAMLVSRTARRRDRAVRVPAVTRRAADRAADQRARRLVLPPEQRAAALRRRSSGATTPSCSGRRTPSSSSPAR